MDLNVTTTVIDKSQSTKLVHEVVYPRSRRADQLCECLVRDLDIDRLQTPVLAEICEKQKNAREPLFSRVEELIDYLLRYGFSLSEGTT